MLCYVMIDNYHKDKTNNIKSDFFENIKMRTFKIIKKFKFNITMFNETVCIYYL